MLNPLSLLKGAKVFLILGAISYGLYTLNGFRADWVAQTNATITASAEKVSAQARAEVTAHANQQLEAILETEREFREETQTALNELNDTFTEIRREQTKQKQVLEGDRLSRLANSRVQGRIERLSNKATAARFREVEGIFNEN